MTGGNIKGYGRVDGIIGERDGAKIRETAEEKRERPNELEIRKVDRVNMGSGGLARNTLPIARGVISAVPGGEGVGWVGKALLDLQQVQTFLV